MLFLKCNAEVDSHLIDFFFLNLKIILILNICIFKIKFTNIKFNHITTQTTSTSIAKHIS